MWMEERMGKKVNTERTDEALASASDTLAVGCPFCNIMLSDGITERHAGDRMQVRDVAQILLESVQWDGSDAVAPPNGRSSADANDYPATKQTEEMTGTAVGPDDPATT